MIHTINFCRPEESPHDSVASVLALRPGSLAQQAITARGPCAVPRKG